MSTPRSARSDLGGLVEDDLHVARVLAVLGGELARASATARRRRARRRGPRPSRRPCGRRRARRRRAASRPRSSAARSSPGAPRQPRAGPARSRSSPREAVSMPRVCAAPPCAPSASRSASRSSARVDVERERRDLVDDGSARRPRARAARGARGCRGRTRARSRRAARAAARSCRCRGGRARRRRRRRGVPREQRVDLAGGQQRAVAGDEQDALGAALDAPARRRAARRALWPRSCRLVDDLGAVAVGERLGAGLAGDDEDRVDRPRRGAARRARR